MDARGGRASLEVPCIDFDFSDEMINVFVSCHPSRGVGNGVTKPSLLCHLIPV
jgi:hypothetical protein